MKKKKNEITIRSSAAEYLTYVAATGDNEQSFEVRYQDENIWLTQKMMAVLYDVSVQNIGQHIKKVFADSELERAATIKKFFIVQKEGEREVSREVEHYSLQMIIAVGFKVNNDRAVPMTMEDWAKHLDLILQADGNELLTNAGKISAQIAEQHALTEFEKYRVIQDKLFEKECIIQATGQGGENGCQTAK
jgi:hypothetical protein